MVCAMNSFYLPIVLLVFYVAFFTVYSKDNGGNSAASRDISVRDRELRTPRVPPARRDALD